MRKILVGRIEWMINFEGATSFRERAGDCDFSRKNPGEAARAYAPDGVSGCAIVSRSHNGIAVCTGCRRFDGLDSSACLRADCLDGTWGTKANHFEFGSRVYCSNADVGGIGKEQIVIYGVLICARSAFA